ncbi:MAG: DNA repair protein RecN [Myxococcaceae bacterium]
MLTHLRIQNFVIIDEAELTLGPGLTVVTGDSGAGKSLVLDALELLLGGRGDADCIQNGADEAVVEGVFAVDEALRKRLDALGLPLFGDELSVRRLLHRSGRNKVYLNGALVTVGVVAQLFEGMLAVSTQHRAVSLFDPTAQLAWVDDYGRTADGLNTFGAAYREVARLKSQIRALEAQGPEAEQRLDFLRFQLSELERLGPIAGEETALEQERVRWAFGEKLSKATLNAEALLVSVEGSVSEKLGQSCAQVRDAARRDAALAPLLARLDALGIEAADVAHELGRYGRGVESHPSRLAEVDERLADYKRLMRKHATDGAGLVALQTSLQTQCEQLEGRDEALKALAAELRPALEAAWTLARALTEARKQAAQKLSHCVSADLQGLGLRGAAFQVHVEAGSHLLENGADVVELHFSANLGEPLRPLAKVASGGEASRLLLVLLSHLANVNGARGYVFDEVDAGMGGAIADFVGRRLKALSQARPVLCVTHVPQVAAYADGHWVLQKSIRDGKTVTRLTRLGAEAPRERELARMLSGPEVTDAAMGAAKALVASAHARTRRHRVARTRPLKRKSA